ncbi:MAG: DUF2203 domain-containing protein [Chloroflexi bacterium]|nr:DUF2203 domain-containing protein [Chloroflexota bacterium]
MSRLYDIDAANARLVEVRPLLEALRLARDELAETQRTLLLLRESNGSSDHAEEVGRRERQIRVLVGQMKKAVIRLEAWDITLRDIGIGLVDFPALANGRPIWLCWRLGDGDVDWWHETSEGFGGRKPLSELT